MRIEGHHEIESHERVDPGVRNQHGWCQHVLPALALVPFVRDSLPLCDQPPGEAHGFALARFLEHSDVRPERLIHER